MSYQFSIIAVNMRKIQCLALALALLILNACSKSDNKTQTNNARTVANFSGSYGLVSATAVFSGFTINLYDSLPSCERDNIIQLNTDMSSHFVDAGEVCVPPSDSSGNWSLSANTDTLYIAGQANYINSWNGSTLVLNTNEKISGFPVTATTTLKKK